MSNFKGKGFKKNQVDLNDEANFGSIVKEITKQHSKGKSNVVAGIINKITSNPKLTAILGAYCMASGIGLNIYFIYKLIKVIINIVA